MDMLRAGQGLGIHGTAPLSMELLSILLPISKFVKRVKIR
jgi:hypothetical protein